MTPLSKKLQISTEKRKWYSIFYHMNKTAYQFLSFTDKNDIESMSQSSMFRFNSSFNRCRLLTALSYWNFYNAFICFQKHMHAYIYAPQKAYKCMYTLKILKYTSDSEYCSLLVMQRFMQPSSSFRSVFHQIKLHMLKIF